MDIFKEVKSRVRIINVCNLLGIKLNRNNFCICPFHKERSPSFSVHPDKNIFTCFRMSVQLGDTITLVSKILNVSPFEAVKYLNDMLHLGIDIKSKRVDQNKVNLYLQQREAKKRFEDWENKTFQFLCDLYHKLSDWKKIEDPEKDEYIYALKNIDYVSYLIDEIFIYGTDEEKLWFKRNLGKKVDEWKQKMLIMNI